MVQPHTWCFILLTPAVRGFNWLLSSIYSHQQLSVLWGLLLRMNADGGTVFQLPFLTTLKTTHSPGWDLAVMRGKREAPTKGQAREMDKSLQSRPLVCVPALCWGSRLPLGFWHFFFLGSHQTVLWSNNQQLSPLNMLISPRLIQKTGKPFCKRMNYISETLLPSAVHRDSLSGVFLFRNSKKAQRNPQEILSLSQRKLSFILSSLLTIGASLVAQMVKNLPAIQETWIWSLGREDPLEKGMATHSSILA